MSRRIIEFDTHEKSIIFLFDFIFDHQLIHDAQLCGAELLETVFSLYTDIHKYSGGEECIYDMARRLIVVQAELSLKFIAETSSVMLSLFVSLIQSELEHIQLSIIKLVIDFIKWKSVNGKSIQLSDLLFNSF